jgi:hypothetical protein
LRQARPCPQAEPESPQAGDECREADSRFGKGTNRFPETVWDVFQGTGVSKDHHDWEQGLDEAVHYLEALVPAGSLVVDPLMGSSTCGAAALRCGMRFQGCEIDTETFQQAKGRIAEETKGKNGR